MLHSVSDVHQVGKPVLPTNVAEHAPFCNAVSAEWDAVDASAIPICQCAALPARPFDVVMDPVPDDIVDDQFPEWPEVRFLPCKTASSLLYTCKVTV